MSLTLEHDVQPIETNVSADPVWVVEEVLGVKLYSRQREILRAVWGYDTALRRTAVKAAHSVGKTMLAACATVAWIVTHEQGIVLTTAPTHRQVEDILWREIRTRWRDATYELSPKPPNTTDWNVSEDRWAKGFSTDKGDKFQGYHSKNVLIIVDEASGVTDEIFEAIEGVMLGGNARLLIIGNPNYDGGEFFEAFEGPAAALYNQFSIAADDTPLFTGEMLDVPWGDFLITPQAADELRVKYKNHPSVLSVRLDAEFPSVSDWQIISRALIRQAYDTIRPTGGKIAGLDVAVGGGDDTAFILMDGGRITEMEVVGLDSTDKNVEYAKQWLNRHKPSKCVVDANGVGRGVYDYLALAGYPVAAFHAQGKPRNTRRFYNAAAEGWWLTRECFERLDISLDRSHPLAGQLTRELSGAVYEEDNLGRIKIDKYGMNKQSPNLAEALMMLVRERHYSTPQAMQRARGRKIGGSWGGEGGSRGKRGRLEARRKNDHAGADDDPGVIDGYERMDGSVYSVR
jgi:phage terminase large subunit